MSDESKHGGALDLRRTAIIAVLVGLSFLGTMFIRLPVPATTGYFNIGDIFVILAGLWLGPVAGLLVGLVGPTAADLVGFPQFVVATAITKGLEGLVTGLVAKSRPLQGATHSFAAAFAGGMIIVVGYYLFEAVIYPAIGRSVPFFAITTPAAAWIEVPVNAIQAIIAVFGGVALWRLVTGGRQRVRGGGAVAS